MRLPGRALPLYPLHVRIMSPLAFDVVVPCALVVVVVVVVLVLFVFVWKEQDATDVMAAFHSDDAFDRLKRLPVVKGKEGLEPSVVTKNYRAFRKELVRRNTRQHQVV